MNHQYFSQICEALLFSSSEPVSIEILEDIIGEGETTDFRERFLQFISEYNQTRGGLKIIEVADGFALATRPEFARYIRRLKTVVKRTRLSRAACEVLAIIAYQQPVTVPEIDHIRGVDSSGVIRNLLEKDFVAVLGKRHGPGNPLLYGTTQKFLLEFGLKSLSALPSLEEFEREMESLQPQKSLPFISVSNEAQSPDDSEDIPNE